MKLRTELNEDLQRALNENAVEVLEPREQMIQLNGVVAGDGFSKPFTNVLLLMQRGGRWEAFVDDDFYYVGNDPVRRGVFRGRRQSHWTRLQLSQPLAGDVNEAILSGLRLIDSPVLGSLTRTEVAAEPHHESQGNLLSARKFSPPTAKPCPSQLELVEQLMATVCREMPPTCPLVTGPTGSGKTTLANLAAARLNERGAVNGVLLLAGAELTCGTLLQPQRDDRLRETLQLLVESPDTLVVLEQFQFVLARSPACQALLADALDGGLKMIAVASSGLPLGLVRNHGLTRRLRQFRTPMLRHHELCQILESRLADHLAASRCRIVPEVIPVIAKLAHERRGANPGAALGLLEDVLVHAVIAKIKCLGPDEVYEIAT